MALSGTQLDATASVPETFTYNPAAGTIPAIGSDTLTVVLTPTDATNYTTATASVTVIVVQPKPVLGSLSPAFRSASGSAFVLTVGGSGFTSASVVEWGSTALSTQFVSGSQLTAHVSASAITSAGGHRDGAESHTRWGRLQNLFERWIGWRTQIRSLTPSRRRLE
jgi:hypothetical protein